MISRKLLAGSLAFILALGSCSKKRQGPTPLLYRSLIDNGWSKGGVSYQPSRENYYEKFYSGDIGAWIETTLDGDVLGSRYRGKLIIFKDYLHDKNPFAHIKNRDDIRLYSNFQPIEFRIDSIEIYDKNHRSSYGIDSDSKEYEELEKLCKTNEFLPLL